ncbi:hypothetical protein ACVWXQ_000177, partial [Bradyrhizobium sp. S3.14.4]
MGKEVPGFNSSALCATELLKPLSLNDIKVSTVVALKLIEVLKRWIFKNLTMISAARWSIASSAFRPCE